MTRSADSVSESVRSGALGLRALAVETGKAGAEMTAQAVEIAERKFSEGTGEFAKASRRTRKNFVKKTKTPRRELRKSSTATRRETLARAAELREPGRKAKKAAILAAKSVGDSRRRGKKNFKAAKKDFRAAMAESRSAVKGERLQRRRRPWLVGVVVAVAAVAAVYARRSRRASLVEALPPQSPPAPEEKPAEKPVATTAARPAPSPTPRNGQEAPSVSGGSPKK